MQFGRRGGDREDEHREQWRGGNSYYICEFVIPPQLQKIKKRKREKESSYPYTAKPSSLAIASWRANFQERQIKKAGKFQLGEQTGKHKLQERLTLRRARIQHHKLPAGQVKRWGLEEGEQAWCEAVFKWADNPLRSTGWETYQKDSCSSWELHC